MYYTPLARLSTLKSSVHFDYPCVINYWLQPAYLYLNKFLPWEVFLWRFLF